MAEIIELDNRMMGENLRKARTARGMTKTELAKRLEISLPAYRKIESGQTRIINSHYEKCAEILGIPLIELINGFMPVMDSAGVFEDARAEYLSRIDQLSDKVASLETTLQDKDRLIYTQELLIEHLQK
ncbi:MAG: helix-turn-helix transcriptional regulator [Bacteroidales bacterium]|jgi:transcriptional regulator with XRE-family HTH domain|nr:helix-turn-helix transcriptional regulator [Bacteroidales bacterium]MBR5397889.1 helix-turn-helix transcriptional regulator [Bacteroidales bacterium]